MYVQILIKIKINVIIDIEHLVDYAWLTYYTDVTRASWKEYEKMSIYVTLFINQPVCAALLKKHKSS